MGYDSAAADAAGFRCRAVACNRRTATLLELTGDDILVQRGAARAKDERAANVGIRARARREAMLVQVQLPTEMWGRSLRNATFSAKDSRRLCAEVGNQRRSISREKAIDAMLAAVLGN
tara:strand:- start:21943 stop:22299 length:357 start_codon:yes stop_codon:yes gene_type:complete